MPPALVAVMFSFRPLETILESRSTPESPASRSTPESPVVPEPSTSLETFLQALSKQTDIMSKPTPDQDAPSLARTRSNTIPKLALRNPSQRVREWIKRSNSTRYVPPPLSLPPPTNHPQLPKRRPPLPHL